MVSVEVLVDESGAVRDSRFVKKVAQNVGLNEAALTAAQQAKFRPATKSGVRVKMWIRSRSRSSSSSARTREHPWRNEWPYRSAAQVLRELPGGHPAGDGDLDRQIEEELAKVKDRLAELQNAKKASRQMYDAACMRLGIANDLAEEEESAEV